MSEIGWIKLHRKLLKNPVVMKDADHLAVWVYLLLNAKREKTKTFFAGKPITLKPGQIIVGRRGIANDLSISDSKVQRVLKTFATEHLFEQQTTSVSRLVSINKWQDYQISEPRSEPRSNHEVNHEKNGSEPRSEPRKKVITNSKTDGNAESGSPDEPQSDEEVNHEVNHEVNTVLKKYKEDKEVVVNEPFFEFFRRAAGSHISDTELIQEIGKFKNKYPNIHPNKAGALINTWVSRIGQQPVFDPRQNKNSWI